MPTTGPVDLAALEARLAEIPNLDADALEAAHVQVLGRKAGQLTQALKGIAALPVEERRTAGAALNRIKQAFEAAFADRRRALARAERADDGAVDRTMPPRRTWTGGLHPVTRAMQPAFSCFRRGH